jgi:hypothetical protein
LLFTWEMVGQSRINNSKAKAPAGGAAAAAPERGALGTYLYLHAVGAGNPIAVPGMAR